MKPRFLGKSGLEIGGPSRIFQANHLIPVYDICNRIDICNFSLRNIWSESAASGEFVSNIGKTFTGEAGDLRTVPDASYEFVLASHVLEHTANPLRALREWRRVLVPGGVLLVIVPDRRNTFDHRREVTCFEHIESDFQADAREDDVSHIEEILSLHDLELDPEAGSVEEFRERCLRNISVRAMHHHVFDSDLLSRLLDHIEMKILNTAVEQPFHIIGFAEKV
jgi:ubiquinone/menaquinone biosynthesis C-methylase UbiE